MTETDKPKHPGGRPSLYKPEYAKEAQKLCLLGATDKDLADFFEVSIMTIWRWSTAHEEFRYALKVGKDAADDRVERSLYQKAIGYSFDAMKIFNGPQGVVKVEYVEHIPPSDTAGIFWLKNRRKDEWREKQEPADIEGERETVIRVTGGPPARVKSELNERQGEDAETKD